MPPIAGIILCMRETITTIRSPLIDNFIRIIQSLAKHGAGTSTTST